MRRLSSLFSLVLTIFVFLPTLAAQVDLQKGDRIVFIGSNTAERFQYFGYWEALLQAQFKEMNLSVRNQGFNGDEVRFRPRSLDFGTPADHLTRRHGGESVNEWGQKKRTPRRPFSLSASAENFSSQSCQSGRCTYRR